jgi:hypothetical protein
MLSSESRQKASPARLLGDAVRPLRRVRGDRVLQHQAGSRGTGGAMDVLVAEAILEFGDDLRAATEAVS